MKNLQRRSQRSVLLLSLLSTTSLAMTEREAAYLLVALVTALVSWYFVETELRLRVPKLLVSAGIIAALAFACLEVLMWGVPLVPALGRCFVYCQLCKYFQRKTNREYGEIAVLSMMVMMTAAAISFELTYAVLLVCYVFLGTYSLQLFGLKRDAEALADRRIRAGLATDRHEALAAVGMPSSGLQLRGATTVAAVVTLAVACVVFVLVPRVAAGTAGKWRSTPQVALTGFSDKISFGDIGKLLNNSDVVLRVQFRRGGQVVRPKGPIRLRGATYALYDKPGSWQRLPIGGATRTYSLDRKKGQHLLAVDVRQDSGLDQEVWLEPISSKCLFATYVPYFISSGTIRYLEFVGRYDQTLRMAAPPVKQTHYHVRSLSPDQEPMAGVMRAATIYLRRLSNYLQKTHAHVPESIGRLASEWVAGIQEAGMDPQSLAQARAQAIEKRLREGYTHTLNLGDVDPRVDPVEDFLIRRKTGHCEYFASAMTLMCQTLGIPARLVTGLAGGRYNPMGEYYTFQQNNAHAWVEALIPGRGWVTFDPTPRDLEAPHAWSSTLRGYADFFQHRWSNKVVNFGITDHVMLMAYLETWWRGVRRGAADISRGWIQAAFRVLGMRPGALARSEAIAAIAGLCILLAVFAAVGVGIRLFNRRRSRRPGAGGQHRIVVEFYEEMTRLLARRGHVRPPGLTQLEFAQSLVQAQPRTFPQELVAAVRCFYQVRFGGRSMSQQQRDLVQTVLRELRARAATAGAFRGEA